MRHARTFFDRADYDLASAAPGSFAIKPVPVMVDLLRRDYQSMSSMIFGDAPAFDDVLASISALDAAANGAGLRTGTKA